MLVYSYCNFPTIVPLKYYKAIVEWLEFKVRKRQKNHLYVYIKPIHCYIGILYCSPSIVILTTHCVLSKYRKRLYGAKTNPPVQTLSDPEMTKFVGVEIITY